MLHRWRSEPTTRDLPYNDDIPFSLQKVALISVLVSTKGKSKEDLNREIKA